jgi:CBS domain-containing protein
VIARSGSTHESANGGNVNPVSNQTTALQKAVSVGGAVIETPIHVSEVMTKDAKTLAPEQSFAEAVALMANQSFRHILIADEDERLQGVVSDRDVLRALARTPNWNDKTVSEIMTSDLVTVTPDAPISVAVKAMLAARINCLPVIGPDGRVCGILTSTDLLKAYEKIQALIEKPHS